jgi:hypothetical protein
MKESHIEQKIYFIRHQKVMLDSDLAELYGVETRTLKQAVKRNMNRFPEDFAFLPDNNELNDLRSQFVISNDPTYWNHNWVSPLLFTEYGVSRPLRSISLSFELLPNLERPLFLK